MRPWQRPPPPICIKMAAAQAAAAHQRNRLIPLVAVRLGEGPAVRFVGLEQLSEEELEALVERVNQLVVDEATRRRTWTRPHPDLPPAWKPPDPTG